MISIKNLEDLHNRLLENRISEYIENRVALLKVLKQINCIIDNYSCYEDDESIYKEYEEFRKLIVDWLIECSTEPKIDIREQIVILKVVVKVKKSFEKTRHVKNNDKSK